MHELERLILTWILKRFLLVMIIIIAVYNTYLLQYDRRLARLAFSSSSSSVSILYSTISLYTKRR